MIVIISFWLGTDSSSLLGNLKLTFRLISLDSVDWNFSQLIIPLIKEGFVIVFGGEVSRVRSTGEWSEWRFDKLILMSMNLVCDKLSTLPTIQHIQISTLILIFIQHY